MRNIHSFPAKRTPTCAACPTKIRPGQHFCLECSQRYPMLRYLLPAPRVPA